MDTRMDKRMSGVRILSTVLILAVAGSVAAQDSPDIPPYFLLVDSTLATEDAGDWAAAVAVTAKAHAQHPKGNVFATYRRLTGGPDEAVRVFFPFDKMADLDEWVSNRQVLYEVVGKDRGDVVLDDLELELETSERILSYSERLSRPAPSVRAPKYLWAVEVQVEAGEMVAYSAVAERVKKAHDQSSRGQTWLVYGNALGGDSSELTYLYGFDEFASVDNWPSRTEVLSAAYGEEEAARLLAALESMTRTRTGLWALESELSQLEGE